MITRENNRLLVVIAMITYATIALFHLVSAKAGYSHYRDIHLGTAIEYAKGKIDILRPIIVGFTATGTPTPQELPIWQALAAAMFKLFGMWFGWANLLSLVLFATGLWPLNSLASRHIGSRGAWWTSVFFLTQPIIIFISGQASADGLSLVLAIWFLFFADNLIRSGRVVWLLPSVTFGALSAVTKLPLYMCAGLTSVFLLLFNSPRSAKRWLLLTVTGAITGFLFLVWIRYTESCLAQAEFSYVDLRLSHNPAMWQWYFGDWHYRLNPFNWGKGGWAALNGLLGSFALIILPAWALIFGRNTLAKAWLLAAVCTTTVFSHLVLVHKHYFILYSPAVALLCGTAALKLEELFGSGRRFLVIPALWSILLLCAVQGLMGIKIVLDYDSYPHRISQIIDANTTPEDKLLIEGGGWGGEDLFLSSRNGLSIDNTQMLENPETLNRLLSLGYTKLVMISESPLLHALQVIDPGNLNRERISYRIALTPITESWKTILESDDVLIKELPPTNR